MAQDRAQSEIKYAITNDTVTVITDDGSTVTVKRGEPNFASLRDALLSGDWRRARENVTVKKKIADWAKGRFSYDEVTACFAFDGRPVPSELNERIIEMATRDEDPQSLFNFFERLSRNPSMRSVEQLFKFLKHVGIPITDAGTFLAYKGVNQNLTDKHTGKFDNSPGKTHKMPRNQISDDPRHACHVGFHVGSESYAKGFGERVVVCEVDPENVVCVPYDCSEQKMRVCEYTVIGHHGCTLPTTAIGREDVPAPQSEPPAAAEQNDLAAEVTAVTASARSVPAKYERFLAMTPAQLLTVPYKELREYATHGLKIVGASKITGGRTAIVNKILELIGAPA